MPWRACCSRRCSRASARPSSSRTGPAHPPPSARGSMVLCAHPSRPYRTLPDLIAAAKAKPGGLTYGTTGIGSNGHLTVAALSQLTDIRLVHVPYRGAAPLLNDGTAGHVDMVISSSATVAPQVESGQLRALIQFGDQRASFIPDTATAV